MDIKRYGIRLGWVLLALFTTGPGAAQELRDGTRLLLTDIDSKSIVGYGEVSRHELELSLSRGSASFLLLLVQVDGTVETFRGDITADGVELITSGGRRISLDALLRRARVELTLHRLGADPFDAAPDAVGVAEDYGGRGEGFLQDTADEPGDPADNRRQGLNDDGSGDPHGNDTNPEADDRDVDSDDRGSRSGGDENDDGNDVDSGPGADGDGGDDGSGEDDDRNEEPDGDDD